MPDKLIYHSVIDFAGEGINRFTMWSRKGDAKNRTVMLCFPQLIERDGMKNVPSLYIWRLWSSHPGEGFGTAMLNFAQIVSKRLGCNGNFHLYAGIDMAPDRVPHIFYRKYGMNSNDKDINLKLDKFIKAGKNATWVDFPETLMYYPPISFPPVKENRFLKALKTFFS